MTTPVATEDPRAVEGSRNGWHRAGTPPAAIVLGVGNLGIGVYRSLGRCGIPVIAIHSNPGDVALASKFCRVVISPPLDEAAAYERCLMEVGRSLDRPPVLIPTNDRTALFMSERRDVLRGAFRFILPEPHVLRGLINKREFDLLAKAHGLPVPQTFFAATLADIERIAAEVPYPAILKPAYSPAWMRAEFQARFGKGAGGFIKRIVVASPAELAATYAAVARYDPEVVVQDLIVGGDEHLVDVYAYLGSTGKTLAQFAIQKLRVLPIDGNGVGTSVRAVEVPELEELALRFLESVGYRGNAAVCFKKDARDGRYYCIEVNARLALHHALAAACGVNLAVMGYQEALGEAPREQRSPLPRGNMKWVTLKDDFQAALRYRRRGCLSLPGWLRSLAGPKSFVHWAFDDPGPACARFLLTCAGWGPLERGPLAVFRRGLRAVAYRLLTRNTARPTQTRGPGIEEGSDDLGGSGPARDLAWAAGAPRGNGARPNAG